MAVSNDYPGRALFEGMVNSARRLISLVTGKPYIGTREEDEKMLAELNQKGWQFDETNRVWNNVKTGEQWRPSLTDFLSQTGIPQIGSSYMQVGILLLVLIFLLSIIKKIFSIPMIIFKN